MRILVVGVIVEVHLDFVALPDADELAGHVAAERPERVADAVGEPPLELPNFEMHDDLRRMVAINGRRDVGRVGQHGILDADDRIGEVLLARSGERRP